MFREQVRWAAEEGADLIISETHDYLGEALISLEAIQESGLPSIVTFASTDEVTIDGFEFEEACRQLEAQRCGRRRSELLARSADDAADTGADPGCCRLPCCGAAGSRIGRRPRSRTSRR